MIFPSMTTLLGPNLLAAFQGSEYSLRFELGGETLSNLTQPVPRFLQAFDRARAIADAVFPSDGALAGVIGFWELGEFELFHPEAKVGQTGLGELARMGFPIERPALSWSAIPPFFGEEDGVVWDWNAYDLRGRRDLRDVLLWASVASEMGIGPKAPVACYLYAPGSDVLMHVYDDRGMDVTALGREPLRPIHLQFNDWVLEYDRPRIEAVFSKLNDGLTG